MKIVSIFLSLVAFLFSTSTAAEVPWGYRSVAEAYDIPPEILYSVALWESQPPGEYRPWPWTANVSRKGFYFESRQALYEFLNAQLADGRTSFDIGPAQVNWRWNGWRFRSLWEATDPYANLRVAASMIREYYLQTGSYLAAIGMYHSPGNKERAQRYTTRVSAKLSQVLKGER